MIQQFIYITKPLKRLLTLGVLLLLGLATWAQTTDFERLVPDIDYRSKTLEEYLVQLAWHNNPDNKILNTEVAIADNEIKLTKNEWTRDIRASFNINEISLSNIVYGDRLDLPVFYPIYNFTATINLGTFVRRKPEVQNAQYEKLIAEQEVNNRKIEIRREVLERYEKYLLSLEVVKIKVQAEDNAYTTYKLLSEKFKSGKAELEEFTKASETYFRSQEDHKKAQSEIKTSKIAVEEMIGIPLQEAIKLGPKSRK